MDGAIGPASGGWLQCRPRRNNLHEVNRMTIPNIFETCQPRADVIKGSLTEADFAADLAQVISGQGSDEYCEPARFFANTYPTRGLQNLLDNVCRRLSGAGGEVAAIFRLDTSYGGGKTHGLIALSHAARGMVGVSNIEEFVDPSLLLPEGRVRIAAFDGENTDPANGRAMGDGVLAHTPWGEIAYALAGKDGYARVRNSDEDCVAPGAETLRELFGGQPALVLLDELSVYLRKVYAHKDARDQLTAFLTSLFKAVESAPNVALVYTLAIGKDGRGMDAYSEENQFIAKAMAEMESVSARKATLLNPTEDDETVQVLRRRLFESIDEERAMPVIEAYRTLWAANRDSLASDAVHPETLEAFRLSYPFHPEVLETLMGKTATLENFQRVRGMLRLLARVIAHLWDQRPQDATAIHLHHVDPGHGAIRQEIVTRLGQSIYIPAIDNDITALRTGKKALAQEIDADRHAGMPPYAAYAARTIFLHTLAFNERLKGLSTKELRYSILCPEANIDFIEAARKKFVDESAYLDDRPGLSMRFLAEPNLSQIIRRQEGNIDAGEVRAELNDRICMTFEDKTFHAIPFPGGPFDVPDEIGDGRPKLAILAYEAVTVGDSVESVPELIERIHTRQGSEGSALRALRNNLVFVVADDARKDEMRHKAYRSLALRELKQPERLAELALHQQDKIRELEEKSKQELAITIQQCYRHLFYPSRSRIDADSAADLAHSAIDMHSAADRPGNGQRQIERALRDLRKLRLPEDEPDSPAYVRDHTPLKKGQITTLALRNEFRRDPALPILVGDDIFIRGVRRGIEKEEYVYRRGKLLFGPGDPQASIMVDEQSVVFTMAHARNAGIWPRPKPGEPSLTERKAEKPDRPDDVDSSSTHPDAKVVGVHPAKLGLGPFTAEALFRDALVQLWEKVRSNEDVVAIGVLTIRMFEAGDAFRLLGAVGAVSGAEKCVTIAGGYETQDGGSLQLEFKGPVSDARLLQEFLEPQLRDAAAKDLQAAFELTFADGLSMRGDAPEKFTERLAKFASGSAYVSATAQVKE